MRLFRTLGALLFLALLLPLSTVGAAAADKGAPNFLDPPADGPRKIWTGFYAGLHGGYSFASTEVGLNNTPFSVDGLSAQGFSGGVQVGFDYQVPGTHLVPGVFADFTWGSVEFDVNPNLVHAKLGESWTVGGRLGWEMGKVMPYILAGYTETESELSAGTAFTSSPTLKGWTFGGGVEWMLVNNVSLAAEYRYTKYDSEDLLGLGIVNLDTEQHSVMARLKLRTGAFGLFD
ncbi:MAG TPA: outer membrane beta-barrel protein [Polyangiaceae bacterium]|nr:outer membrane beta-barrel protein [Polyangiaceae bacterium]